MPNYSYYCDNCQEKFDIRHSMHEKLEKCGLCGAEDALEKLPSIPTFISSNSQPHVTSPKKGAIVEEYIEINREELKEEKKRLKEVKYE